jgi:hypothetical protein
VSEKREKERRLQERRHHALVEEIRAAREAPAWRESSFFCLLGTGIALVTWALDPPLFIQVSALVVAWLCFCGSCWIALRGRKSRIVWEVLLSLLISVLIYTLWTYANSGLGLVAKLTLEGDERFYLVPQKNEVA